MRTVALIFGVALLTGSTTIGLAQLRWRRASRRLESALRVPASGRHVDFASLKTAPPIVRRYLSLVLRDGASVPAFVRLEQRGEFLMREDKNVWSPFTATQHLALDPPGFMWDAQIAMPPGLFVRVRDSFANNAGSMLGKVLGLVTVVDMQGTKEMSEASLQRYLAEGVWAPAALLPSSRLTWTPLTDSSARASLTVGETTVSLDFFFGDDGYVSRVFSASRARAVGGVMLPTPWQGRWAHYEMRGAVRIPTAGEVEWVMPNGPQPYWKGTVTSYEAVVR